jgi:hypothetical protein
MLISELNQSVAQLSEGVLDMPDDSSLVTQLEILMQRLESAKKALGITNRLQDPAERKKHRSRVMVFLNQLRGAFNKIATQLEQELQQDQAPAAPQLAAVPVLPKPVAPTANTNQFQQAA